MKQLFRNISFYSFVRSRRNGTRFFMTQSRLLILVLIIVITMPGCESGTKASKPNISTPNKATSISKKNYNGPFGLAMGITQDELIKLGFKQDSEEPWTFIGTPPDASNSFSRYGVFSTKQGGLYEINVATDDFIVNGNGDQVKFKVDEIAELLSQKYGKHSFRLNKVNDDVYIMNPEMWFMGLRDKSVVYAYVWKANYKNTKLPNDISYVHVEAVANPDTSGYVKVMYRFTNEDRCLQEIKLIRSSKL